MAKTPNKKIVTKKHLARIERERRQRRYLLISTGVVLGLVVLFTVLGVLDSYVTRNLGVNLISYLFEPNQAVAQVGDDIVTTREFQSRVRYSRYQLIDQYDYISSDQMMMAYFGQYLQQIAAQLSDPQALAGDVLESLIDEKLVEQEAARLGIKVTEGDIDKLIQSSFNFYPEGTPTPANTPTSFATSTLSPTQKAMIPPTATQGPTPTATLAPGTTQAAPAISTPTTVPAPTGTPTPGAPLASATPGVTATPLPTATPYTADGFQKEFKKYTDGLAKVGVTVNDIRAIFKARLMRDKVNEVLTKDVQTKAQQVWARHILVESEDAAKDVLRRLNAGEKWQALAAELSKDESNKDDSGDLGWFTRGKMVKEFEDAAFSLKIGETSQPVKTNFGYHVIQVIGNEVRPLDADQIDQEKQKIYTDWLAKQKTEKNVTKLDVWLTRIPTIPTVPPNMTANLPQ